MSENNDEKVEYVHGVGYRYRTAWINNLESELHWRLYWHQQKILQDKILPGQRILEIGVGTGFTANYLRSKGFDVTTFDIDAEKKPDIIGNIVNYDFKNTYDHILAFEVFEHIPFVEFSPLLKKLACISKQYLFLSVPRNEEIVFHLMVKAPVIKEREFVIRRLRHKIHSKYHFWEVDHPSTSRSVVEQAMQDAGFLIAYRGQVFSFEYYALKSLFRIEK